jgi:hypothetical protein
MTVPVVRTFEELSEDGPLRSCAWSCTGWSQNGDEYGQSVLFEAALELPMRDPVATAHDHPLLKHAAV